jgi:putative heme-binding domain-containing protein
MRKPVPWIVASLFAVSLPGQHSTTTLSNPYTTAEDRRDGAITFRSQCASCHGQDAKGTTAGPDLSRGQFKHAVSEEAMFRVITKGVPGTTMPGFALNGRAAWQVVAFINSLNVRKGGQAGDSSAGAALFTKLKCAGCHPAGAPNPAESAMKLGRAELRQSLLEPDAAVAPEYWRWRGTLRDGSVVEGRRFNEDTFVIQLLGDDRRLRTVQKSNVERSELSMRSKMPSFREKLSPADLDHLIAYLESLRGVSQ